MLFRGNFLSGIKYLLHGFGLLSHPRLRLFVWIPITINVALFIALSVYLSQQFSDWLAWMMDWLPNWLDFLAWIIGIISAVALVIVYGYSFSLLTNLFAAPFYGLLAEKVEIMATGQTPDSEPIVSMIFRTIGRELQKFWYFLWRSVIILLLYFVAPIGQILSVPWSAWTMGVQYADYAADNHRTPFVRLRQQLSNQMMGTMGFGGTVALGMMVPVLNIFVVPAAVIGGTLMWLDCQHGDRVDMKRLLNRTR